jgi:Cys-rich protein (TIGR01571 family)
VLHGQNAEKYNKKINPKADDVCFMEGLKWLAASSCGLFCVVQYPVRQKVRQLYGIDSSENCGDSDLITSFCCPCCDLVQVSRQLKSEKPDLRK